MNTNNTHILHSVQATAWKKVENVFVCLQKSYKSSSTFNNSQMKNYFFTLLYANIAIHTVGQCLNHFSYNKGIYLYKKK